MISPAGIPIFFPKRYQAVADPLEVHPGGGTLSAGPPTSSRESVRPLEVPSRTSGSVASSNGRGSASDLLACATSASRKRCHEKSGMLDGWRAAAVEFSCGFPSCFLPERRVGFLYDSAQAAVSLILSMDPDVVHAVSTSLVVSACAILFASFLGVPLGIAIGISEFRFRRSATTLLNSFVAIPTVVVGLVLYGLLGRQGPLGFLGFLFTPAAIVIGGTVLCTPIVAHYSMVASKGADRRIFPTALTLGAGPGRAVGKFVSEIRLGILAAVIAGFGRVVSEVGVAMMLGGNIRGYTRTMTTAIALETSKGEFELGLALGIFLLTVAFVVNAALYLMQRGSS